MTSWQRVQTYILSGFFKIQNNQSLDLLKDTNNYVNFKNTVRIAITSISLIIKRPSSDTKISSPYLWHRCGVFPQKNQNRESGIRGSEWEWEFQLNAVTQSRMLCSTAGFIFCFGDVVTRRKACLRESSVIHSVLFRRKEAIRRMNELDNHLSTMARL